MTSPLFLTMEVAACLILLAGCARDEIPCQSNPEIFCGAFIEIRAGLEDEELELIKSSKVGDDHTLMSDIGGYARAHLGLWGENEFTSFFREQGVSHPDTMSNFVADGFILYLNGKPVDMVVMLAADRKRKEELLRRLGGQE